jgi:hypothetical protein
MDCLEDLRFDHDREAGLRRSPKTLQQVAEYDGGDWIHVASATGGFCEPSRSRYN